MDNVKIFASIIENEAREQIETLASSEAYKDCQIRVMPDCHAGDGSLLCAGKGNLDWLNSAPHGAGRIMSRAKARESLTMEDFKNSMNGIYSTSVVESTIDESPMAYKPIEQILEDIKDTVEVIKIIKPIYNFKAK